MRSSLRAASAVLVLVSLGSARAQSGVWVVAPVPGPGVDFTSIQSAVDAAASGDTLLVRTGTYDSFAIVAKSLTVTADTGAEVDVGIPGGALAPPKVMVAVSNLAPTQSVVLHGLRVTAEPNPTFTSAALGPACLEVRNSAGPVWVSACAFQGAYGTHIEAASGLAGARVESSASVVFTECTVRGGIGMMLDDITIVAGVGGPGLIASGSQLAAYETRLEGGRGGNKIDASPGFAGNGGPGATVTNASVFAAGAVIRGGAGGNCLLSGCPGKKGGSGLELMPGASVEILETVVAGGAAGTGGSASCTANPGQDIASLGGTYASLSGSFRGLELDSPLREGQAAIVTLEGEPGDLAFAVVAAAPAHLPVGGVVGPLALAAPWVILPAGIVPPGGSIALPFTVQELGAGVEGARVFAQGFFASAAGSWLGEPGALVLLDASF